MRPSGARFHLRPFGKGADLFVFDSGDLSAGPEYINDFEPDVDRLDLGEGVQSETLSDGRVRVYKAPAVGFGAFGFESDAAPFGFEIDGDGGGGLI